MTDLALTNPTLAAMLLVAMLLAVAEGMKKRARSPALAQSSRHQRKRMAR